MTASRERTVEIDEMQPPGTVARKPRGELGRVPALDRYPLAHALVKAHGATLHDVDGRDDLEDRCRLVLTCYHASMIT